MKLGIRRLRTIGLQWQAIKYQRSIRISWREFPGGLESFPRREAFITLEDHKPNFPNNPKCRLINPAKSEIGIISKHHVDKINKAICKKQNFANGEAQTMLSQKLTKMKLTSSLAGFTPKTDTTTFGESPNSSWFWNDHLIRQCDAFLCGNSHQTRRTIVSKGNHTLLLFAIGKC